MHQSKIRYDAPIVSTTRETVAYQNNLEGIDVVNPREAMYRSIEKQKEKPKEQSKQQSSNQRFVIKRIVPDAPKQKPIHQPSTQRKKPDTPAPIIVEIPDKPICKNCVIDGVITIPLDEAALFLHVSLNEIIAALNSGGGIVGETGHTVALSK